MGDTTVGKEGYGTSMHVVKDLTNGDSLMEAVTKYAERVTHVEECMAQIEAKFEEKVAMMSMQQLPQPT